MKHSSKRLLSILLSLVLMLGLMPGAYAATNIGISVSGLTVTWRQYSTFFVQDMTVSDVSDTGFTAVANGHYDDRVNSNQWTLYYIDFQNTTDGNMKLALNYSIVLHAGSFDDGYGRVNLEGKDYSGNEFVKEASDTQSSYSGSLEFLISAHSTRTIDIVSGKSPDNNTTLTVSNLSLTAIPVTNVTLDKTTATLTVGGDPVTLTAGIEPSTATGKTVKWSVGGTNASAVTLYSDADCTQAVGTAATDVLTVYAKGVSAGSATVTATSNADSTKSASCAVTVNAPATGKVIKNGESYYIGDTITFSAPYPWVRFDDDSATSYIAQLVSSENTTVPTPTYDKRCSQWKFTGVWKYDFNGFTSNVLRITGSNAVTPTGFKCSGGTGTQSDPYTFEAVYPPHTHSFTYTASGDTITATCGAADCGLTSNPTLTIVAPTMTVYQETGKSEVASLTGLQDFNTATGKSLAVTNIMYVGRDGTEYTESNTAPTNAGKYTATITLSGVKTAEGENKSVAASVDYSIKYSVTFNTNGGSAVPQQLVEAGESATRPTDPTREGNIFGGWYKDAGYAEKYNFNDEVTQNTTVYAKWGEHRVTWTVGEYSLQDVFTGNAPAADSNTMANLAAESLKPDGATLSWKTETDVSGDVTHTAQFSFPVTLNVNGGTINAGNVESYINGTGATLPTDVTRAKYDFGGWYANSELTGTAVTQIGTTATGSKEYWAKWTAVYAVPATVTANNRAYDGTEKPLVTVTGTATGGEMQYALGTATEATQPYTPSIPTATETGTYYVWYKVVGDSDHNDTEPGCVPVTISFSSISFVGGGLRRRVLNDDPKQVVNFTTDLRLEFKITLPAGASILTDGSSYFDWGVGKDMLNRRLKVTNVDPSGSCSLVIADIRKAYFDTVINARLHVAYTYDGETYTIESEIGSRSVNEVCNNLNAIPATHDTTWGEYARYLLGLVKDYRLA